MRHFTIAALAVIVLAGPAWGQTIPEKIGFQGRLTDASGNPISGSANLTFKLYTAGGTEKWSSGALGVTLSGGLYSVELGDTAMSALPFDEPYHLGVQVESDDEMTPRYSLLAAPYAMRAKMANDADTLDGLHAAAFATLAHNHDSAYSILSHDHDMAYWKLGGNAGTTPGTHYLGTSDDVALEIQVNGLRALRLEPFTASPNLIGGYRGNSVTSGVAGATVGGGGHVTYPNLVTDLYGTVAGGAGNQAGDNAGTTQDKTFATVGGGYTNTASAAYAVVGGGLSNTASGMNATVGGGYNNTASGINATVGGGRGNTAAGNYSFVAGRRAHATHDGTSLFADQNDFVFNSAAANEFAARATGGVRFVTAIDGAGAPTISFSIAGTGDVNVQGMVTATGFSGPLTGTASNADQLDGQHAEAFAPASGSDAYVAKSGDTMTGTLYLPTNGLVAGTNQLVLYGGNIGINTATPSETLDVVGNMRASGNIKATGYTQSGIGGETLRMIRGTVGCYESWTTIDAGSGFSTSGSRGGYNVTFSTPFSSVPTVVVTPKYCPIIDIYNISNNGFSVCFYDLVYNKLFERIDKSVVTGNMAFIAIGPP